MVEPWTDAINKGIKLSKFRIAHHEGHGVGTAAMQDKEILKKQERAKQKRKEKYKI